MFSIGEPTTEIAKWAVERQGFEVVLYQDKTTLWAKLKRMLEEFDEDILRVDADVICNDRIKYLKPGGKTVWTQSHCYDWYKQNVIPCSVGVITAEAMNTCRTLIDEYKNDSRPETRLWRLDPFHSPRICRVLPTVVGVHGYKQTDLARIKAQKAERGQAYDWELYEAVSKL